MDVNLLSQIKSSVDLVRVVEGYCGPGRRAGVNVFYRCCFHQEKTGSFAVNSKKQLYNCHGCHAGGDVVKFIQEIEHVPFMEAVKILATMGGVEIKELTEADKRAYVERRRKVEAEQAAFEKWLGDMRQLLRGEWAAQDVLDQASRRWLFRRRLPASDFDVRREDLAWELQFTTESQIDRLKKAMNVLDMAPSSMILDLFRNQRAWLRGPRPAKIEYEVCAMDYEDWATAFWGVIEMAKEDFWTAARLLRDGIETATATKPMAVKKVA